MKTALTYTLLLLSAFAFSQQKDKYLPKGNRAFSNKEYAEAEADYRISQSKSPTNARASYNLGNAIYMQNHTAEAMYGYSKAIENAKTKPEKHMAYHNMGNALMKEKNYQAAVEAYKNALRNNPLDDETRYNYALAKKMLKDNPPPPPEKNKDDKDKNKDKDNKNQQPNDPKDQKDKGGDKDKDKKDKDKGDQKDKGDNKQNDKGDNGKDKKDDQGQGDKPQQSQASPSKQRLENLLDAMNNEEKKVQDKLNKAKEKARPVRQEKDW